MIKQKIITNILKELYDNLNIYPEVLIVLNNNKKLKGLPGLITNNAIFLIEKNKNKIYKVKFTSIKNLYLLVDKKKEEEIKNVITKIDKKFNVWSNNNIHFLFNL